MEIEGRDAGDIMMLQLWDWDDLSYSGGEMAS